MDDDIFFRDLTDLSPAQVVALGALLSGETVTASAEFRVNLGPKRENAPTSCGALLPF